MDSKQNTKKETSAVSRNASFSQVQELNDQLLKSVYKNDLIRVKELLREGANINAEGYAYEGNFNLYTPLTLAAEEGYVELFETLLQTPGVNVNQGDYYGSTALHKASSMGHTEIVELLLEKEDVNVNVKDVKHGFTPLILAAWRGHEEVVEKLLAKPGILVNEKNKYGQTALHKSISNGHIEMMKILLQVQGILVNEKDYLHEHTPVHLAADYDGNNIAKDRYVEAFEALLSHPDINVNVKDKYGQTPLHTSAYHGNLRIVAMLLEAGVDPNEKNIEGQPAVYWAAKQGHVGVVEMIVNHIKRGRASGVGRNLSSKQVDALAHSVKYVGVDKEYQSSNRKVNDLNDQLLLAAKNGDLDKVQELLKQPGIDVNCTDRYKKNTPLHLASENGHLEVVKALLNVVDIKVNAKNKDNTRSGYPIHIGDDRERHKVDIGKTPLYLAVAKGHLEVVKVLVNDVRTDVNAKDKYGSAALHIAVRADFIEIVEILLSHPKIDVNVSEPSNDHFTSLHRAVDHTNFEIVKMLLNHPNINVNLKDKYYECTPLHLAVRGKKLDMVEAILNHPKIDVNVIDKYDQTPLHDAAEHGYVKILNYLLNANANVNVRNISGKTPLDLARERKHVQCVKALQNA